MQFLQGCVSEWFVGTEKSQKQLPTKHST